MRHGVRVRDVSGRCYRSLFLVPGMAQQGRSMEAPAGSSTRPMGAGTFEGVGIPPGLQTDCETLLSRFQEMDSVRFEDFAELWRSMKFATIFWWVCLAPPLGERSLGPRPPPGWSPWVALALCWLPHCIFTASIRTQMFAFRPLPTCWPGMNQPLETKYSH